MAGHRCAHAHASLAFVGATLLDRDADAPRAPLHAWCLAAKLHPGVYALKVYGNLSEEMVSVLEENGVPYVPNEDDD